MIGSTIQHYAIREEIGRGAMGVVYRAEDTRLDREVALKFLPPELAADDDAAVRFVREAKSASALDHPNICTIHDIGETDEGRLFIVMALYSGVTLKDRLRDGPLPPEEAASIALQIARGLASAHDAGVIHRDIKPANIMLTDDGNVRILDFGVAKLAGEVELTRDGAQVGTTSYMSPEQIRGEDVDARSDLWALGAVLHELLSGQPAFSGQYDQAVVYSVLNEEPEPLTDVPQTLDAVRHRLLQKNAEQRYQSAQEVVDVLERDASIEPIESDSRSAPQQLAGRGGMLRWTLLGMLILATAVWIVARPFTGDSGSPPANADPDLIAVLPFSVRGDDDLDYMSESMVTLVGASFDGVGNLRAVDDNVVLEQVNVDPDANIGPQGGVDYAARFNAGRFVLGSVVRAGDELQISADLYDRHGVSIQEASAAYSADSALTEAIDTLASDLLSGILEQSDGSMGALAAKTTRSFDALKHYLTANRHRRAGEFERALSEIDKALDHDSTFALAWYLRGKIQGWLRPHEADINFVRAFENMDELTGRPRRLLEAQRTTVGLEAESTYKAILQDYPDDPETTAELAEVYTHHSTRESDHRKALRLFERASVLTPEIGEFAMHRSDLLAFFGKVDGDPYPLDSLAAAYAGLDSFERGDTLNWSRALDLMDPKVAEYMVLHSRINGSPEDSAASYLRNGSDDAWRAWVYGYPRLSIANILQLGYENPSGVPVRYNYLRLSYQALGMFDRAGDEKLVIPDSLDDHAARLVFDVLTATLPAFRISADSLRSLYGRLLEWDTNAHPLDRHSGSSDIVRAYLLAGISFRSGDRDAFIRDHEAFRAFGADTVNNPVWRSVAAELRALEQWQSGNLERAEELMRDASIRDLGLRDRFYDILALRHQPIWYLGEILELKGELPGAIEQYRAIVGRTWLAAPGWERTARLFDELGDTEEAIRYYELMIDMWRDADEDLQPRVDAARARVDALLTGSAQEPDSRVLRPE